MSRFKYHVPVKVYFGEEQLEYLGEEIQQYGNRILLIYGGDTIKRNGLYDRIFEEIKEDFTVYELSGITANPHIDFIREGVKLSRTYKIEVILAVGGGSVIDVAKFIAAGSVSEIDPWLFFSRWAPIEEALPIITIPTIAGSGSDMDCAGVITNPETKEKLGRSDPALFPKVSFLDPTNTYTVSAYQTACGVADSLSHIIEEYFCMQQDLSILDSIMEDMMKTIIRFGPVVLKEPDNYDARANLMWISSWAINGFINGGKKQTWSCHPMEHEISATYNITHGFGIAVILPKWLEYCLNENTVAKYVQFGVNVFGIDETMDPMRIAKAGIEQLKKFLYQNLGLEHSFAKYHIDRANFGAMAQRACRCGLRFAFQSLDCQDVIQIYGKCIETSK